MSIDNVLVAPLPAPFFQTKENKDHAWPPLGYDHLMEILQTQDQFGEIPSVSQLIASVKFGGKSEKEVEVKEIFQKLSPILRDLIIYPDQTVHLKQDIKDFWAQCADNPKFLHLIESLGHVLEDKGYQVGSVIKALAHETLEKKFTSSAALSPVEEEDRKRFESELRFLIDPQDHYSVFFRSEHYGDLPSGTSASAFNARLSNIIDDLCGEKKSLHSTRRSRA